jgi:hypothetical protein
MFARSVLSICSLLFIGQAIGAVPAGRAGVDYALKTIKVKEDSVVKVVATVTTKNTVSGNTSSVVLSVNDVEVGRDGRDMASTSYSYIIKQPGFYELKAVCSNTRADAEGCTITVQKEVIEEF